MKIFRSFPFYMYSRILCISEVRVAVVRPGQGRGGGGAGGGGRVPGAAGAVAQPRHEHAPRVPAARLVEHGHGQ